MNDYISWKSVWTRRSRRLRRQKAGASRLELCQNLVIGGTTPGFEAV